MDWRVSHRFSPAACAMADRHYSRQKIGSPQFVPPGRCLVLIRENALWTTSWPFAEYTKHEWAGAWVNTLFRNESASLSSELIRTAIAATRFVWQPPSLGIVTFVNPNAVPGVMVRGHRIFGYCYAKAGFKHVGFTKGGLWAWQMLPEEMPDPRMAIGMQAELIA